MLKIAICEDEPIHLKELKNQILKYIPEPCEISAYCTKEELSAFQEIPFWDFDLVFMDIQLGDMSGMQLAQSLSAKNAATQIIFVSQFLDYISDVYEIDHIYFIYKQNLQEYLPKAIHKALEKLDSIKRDCYTFSWNRENYQVSLSSILYMERILRTTEIHTGSTTYKTSEKLKDCLPKLNRNFAICHRSFLVNMRHISAFEPGNLVLCDQFRIPLSRRYADEIQKKFVKLCL